MAEDMDVTTVSSDNNAPKGPVTILGDAYIGETLIARPNGVGDADGIDYDTVSLQWLRDGEPIAGATDQKYTVTSDDFDTQISVRYSYTDLGGTREVVTSDPEPPVPAEDTQIIRAASAYSPLVILGDATVGDYILARPNAVTDENGIDYSSATFQWLRDGDPIPGATSQRYDVTEADIGAEISVEYSYLDLLGTAKSLTSNPKPEVPNPAVEDGILEGTPAADILTAVAGLQQIDGGDGADTAVFAGDQTHYTVSFSVDGVTVTDRTEGGLGTIALDHVELIDFDFNLPIFGGPMDLEQFGGHTGLDAEAFEDLIGVYIAYFNRAPDAIGLSFWGTEFANGASLEEIASLFAVQDETAAAYPETLSNTDFATAVYNNVLGRAADQEGFDFWVGTLDAGTVTRDQFILAVLEGATANPPAGASQDFVDQQQADRAYLETKIDIGAYFAVHKGMSNAADAAQAMALFDGSQGSVQDAVEAIEGHYTDALDASSGDFLMPIVGVMDDPFAV
ncbi:DUF4214 domain-containing protein [Sulfitobacter sp. JBTF-M27]|uniref:DUF4214 domain-containing protein n=2 Tax=Sulfitobacter sediminilitoris TaxID=2698830 RepID=A0A6P0CHL3_9RHOB|nr:DUF4214 domain-containing protein [Sulfitobacter sediminilitoris]NEK24798.1 DUF4214 domain-containing protein [Sulfitobacter sediminilitoris]